MGSLAPFSWLIYFINYHHRLTYNRRILEKLKGGKGDSESAREKEVKRSEREISSCGFKQPAMLG